MQTLIAITLALLVAIAAEAYVHQQRKSKREPHEKR